MTEPLKAGAKPGAPTDWSTEPERSHMWALTLIRWIATGFGRSLTRLLLHPITLYFVIANGKARRASNDYLTRALKRPARFGDVYRHVHAFAATVLDRIYFLRERYDLFDVVTTNGDVVHVPLRQGEGVITVGAHIGSFEAMRAGGEAHGERVAMLMYENNARMINTMLAAVAPQAKLHTISLGQAGAMLNLRRFLDGGGIAGMLGDRTLPGPAGRSHNHWFEFLGKPAPFSDGPFRLAAMLKRRVVFSAGLYHGGNRYELVFAELADFRGISNEPREVIDRRVLEALERYVRRIEAVCVESPYNWFNFYDFWAAADATPPAP